MIINIKLNIEKELENGSFKHFLNGQDFDIYSSKEDEEVFSMISKKPNTIKVSTVENSTGIEPESDMTGSTPGDR